MCFFFESEIFTGNGTVVSRRNGESKLVRICLSDYECKCLTMSPGRTQSKQSKQLPPVG